MEIRLKTAVCNWDQLLDFSVPELVRSQSTFRTDREVLQNCAGFTLYGSASLAVGLTPCMLCVQILLCVACIALLSVEFLAVNTGLGRAMFGKLCLLSTPEGLLLQTINLHRSLKFSTQSFTFSKKLTQKYRKLYTYFQMGTGFQIQ